MMTIPKDLNKIMLIERENDAIKYDDIEIIKKNQIEILNLKSIVSELKILLMGFNIRSDMAEKRISEFEDRSMEVIYSEEQREK